MSSDTATPSLSPGSRKERQRQRCEAWRIKQNERVMAEQDRLREERFANLGLRTFARTGFHQLPSVEVVSSISDDNCECEICFDATASTVTVPLPISTLPLQLATEHFYGSMAEVVENIDNICTLEQFNRTVQLQLLNKVYPEPTSLSDDDSKELATPPATTRSDGRSSQDEHDVTRAFVAMPNLIQKIINSAESFEIPISKVPNGAIIRSHGVKEPPVSRIIVKPDIIEAHKMRNSPEEIRSRYYSIFDYTNPDVEPTIGSRRVARGKNFTPSDAAATAKLLALIPIEAHELWKIGEEWPSGSPEMNYLLYGPIVRFSDPQNYDIRAPPPDWCYLHYRLVGNIAQEMSLYKVFSGVEEPRVFDANFRRIMERSKVQKIFKDLRRIPLNSERTLFLKY